MVREGEREKLIQYLEKESSAEKAFGVGRSSLLLTLKLGEIPADLVAKLRALKDFNLLLGLLGLGSNLSLPGPASHRRLISVYNSFKSLDTYTYMVNQIS